MPHLIDKETGLCIVCKRNEISAIKEGKKYKRQNYDLRKVAIEKITNTQDPNYRAILDRHKVQYEDTLDESQKRKPLYNLSNSRRRASFIKNHALNAEITNEEIQEIIAKKEQPDENIFTERKKNNNRDNLRKVLITLNRIRI
jgi:hypothetical protein